jgi:serine/threonine-protein kinase
LLGVALAGRARTGAESAKRATDAARRIGPYLLAEKIGAGAMGEVYRARHEALDRWFAIKILRAEASAHSRARFESEARLTAKLSHPNTVRIHDFGAAADGSLYYVMELLEGVTLRELVEREGAQPADRVVRILVQLCASLREAHDAGLVHRDIKPDNIVLCRDGANDVVKLLDFGLVRESGGALDASRSGDRVVGTPLFLSPEAIAAPATVGPRSDLYGLGAVAYYLLTGAHVFDGATMVEVCSQHLYAAPRRPSEAGGLGVPAAIERVVLDCLAKNPLERPASAMDLAERLCA